MDGDGSCGTVAEVAVEDAVLLCAIVLLVGVSLEVGRPVVLRSVRVVDRGRSETVVASDLDDCVMDLSDQLLVRHCCGRL